MTERRSVQRGRTLRGAKIVFNSGRSAIDCTVRNFSANGACIEVQSPVGIPDDFHLLVDGQDEKTYTCRVTWRSANRLGLSFERSQDVELLSDGESAADPRSDDNELVRGHMLALRAALDEVRFGVVLLDHELRAQFINRAFRKMWRLSDAKVASKPAFVALMYHGRDTRAYRVPPNKIDSYIAERVGHIKAGDPSPITIRLANGEVLRMQCAVLPNGGRMLSYTYVTDIVRHADELEDLRAALDRVPEGVILLDADLNAQFMNRAIRQLWKVSDEQADSGPAYAELVGDARRTGTYGVPPEKLDAFIASRIALVRAGDSKPRDLRTSDGRHIRSQCTVLPTGGRMLTYCDVTDLVRNAEQLEKLATIDAMTGIYNRRHFLALAEAEWNRFQRYQRPVSMLMVDIDHFKSVNDRFGHAAGDEALAWVAAACREDQRSSDIVGRVGGEEFALLLPETDELQAYLVAERIRRKVETHGMKTKDGDFNLTISIGIATGTLSMSGLDALMRAADEALYQAKSQGRNKVVRLMSLPAPRLAAE